MDLEGISQDSLLELSPILDDAVGVISGSDATNYSASYSGKCKSSQSQNCTGTPCRSVPVKYQGPIR